MICPKCGNQTADDAAFCGVCGTPMGAAAQPAVDMPVQEQYQQEVQQQFEQPSEPVPAAPQQYQEYNTPDYLSGNAPSYGTPPRRYDEPVQQQFEQPVQQEQPVEEEQKPAGIIVDISHDKMTATIRYDTNVGRMLPSYEDVRQALTDTGVVFGIDVDAIRRGIESLSPFVAAKGHLLHPHTIEARNELLLRGVKLPV